MVRIDKLGMCLKLRSKLHFKGFLSFYGTNTLKVVQTRFVWHETRHTTVICIYYCFKMVIIEKLGMCLKLHSMLHF